MDNEDFYKSANDFNSLFKNYFSGLSEQQQIAWYSRAIKDHLIYSQLLSNNGIAPRGIIYLGANVGQLLWNWVMLGFSKLIMVEPLPDKFSILEKVTEYARRLIKARGDLTGSDKLPDLYAIKAAVDSENGTANLNVMSNSTLSSLLPPNETLIQEVTKHVEPGIHLSETIEVRALKLDTLIEQTPDCSLSDFNLLYMNIQGSELRALQGAKATLKHLELIILEVNFTERYFGLPSDQAIKEFLSPFGFAPVWGRKGGDNGFIAFAKK